MPTTPITPAASRLSGPPDRGGPPTDASPGDFAALLDQTTARTAPAEGHEQRGETDRLLWEQEATAPATVPTDDESAMQAAELVVPAVPLAPSVPTAPVDGPVAAAPEADTEDDAAGRSVTDTTTTVTIAAACALSAPAPQPAAVGAADPAAAQGAAPESSTTTIAPSQGSALAGDAPVPVSAPADDAQAPAAAAPEDAAPPTLDGQAPAGVPLPVDAAPTGDDRPHDHGRHRGHETFAAQIADLANGGQSKSAAAREAAPGAEHRATPATPAIPARRGESATPAVPAQPAASPAASAPAEAAPAATAPSAAPLAPAAGPATDAPATAAPPASAPAPAQAAAPAPTPSASAPAAAWAPPALSRGSMHQTVERVHELVRIATMRDGGARATLQLRPVSLGTIDVQLRTTRDGLVATISAGDETGLQALQQAGGELRRSLEDRGVNLVRLDLQLSPGAAGGAGQSGWGSSSGAWAEGGRSGAPASRTAADDSAQDDPAEDEVLVATATRTPAGSLVDVQA